MKFRPVNHRKRGQAMVEGALVLVAFITVLVGTLDLAQVLFVHQMLTERARGAVRWGSVRDYDPTAIRNMVLYGNPNTPDEQRPGIFGLTPSMVQVNRLAPGSTEDRIVVGISNYSFFFFTPFVAGTATGKPIVATIPYEAP